MLLLLLLPPSMALSSHHEIQAKVVRIDGCNGGGGEGRTNRFWLLAHTVQNLSGKPSGWGWSGWAVGASAAVAMDECIWARPGLLVRS